MKKVLLVLFCCIFSLLTVSSQNENAYQEKINFTDLSIIKSNDKINVSFFINLDNINLPSDKMITLVPTLLNADSSHSYKLNSIVISGKNRMKYLKRAASLKNYAVEKENDPTNIIRRNNGTIQQIPVHAEFHAEDWMYDLSLIIDEVITGCYSCQPSSNKYLVESGLLKNKFEPSYQLVYVSPEPEIVKQRSEVYVANLSFKVGESELLTYYQNNNEKLDEIDKIISVIRNDKLMTLNRIEITGYASPEGNYESNITLSENRAHSFSDYLVDKYMLNSSLIKVNWKGEDWHGLRELVVSSNIMDKDQIVDLIDHTININDLKSKIRSLSSGKTYQLLLSEYYPSLRRNEYRLWYVIEPLSIEQARDLIKTKPNYLSLNEMYLVANSYSKNSKEFKDVFDIAVNIYPQDIIARLNAGTAELEGGDIDVAITYLSDLTSAEAFNNLGIAYLRKGMEREGEGYLRKAAQKGLDAGVNNLKQYQHSK